jgi:hypothetical protein
VGDHLYYQVVAGVLGSILRKFVRMSSCGRSRIGPDARTMRAVASEPTSGKIPSFRRIARKSRKRTQVGYHLYHQVVAGVSGLFFGEICTGDPVGRLRIWVQVSRGWLGPASSGLKAKSPRSRAELSSAVSRWATVCRP